MTRLIIKGNKFQAAKAAAERGIPLAFECELRHGTNTVGLTNCDDSILIAWYQEDMTFPQPVGSLLQWTPVEKG